MFPLLNARLASFVTIHDSPDSSRHCIGDQPRHLRLRLLPLYLALSSDVSSRDHTLLSHPRHFYRLVEASWDERTYHISPSVPRHAANVPRDSSSGLLLSVVIRQICLKSYNDDARAQLRGYSESKFIFFKFLLSVSSLTSSLPRGGCVRGPGELDCCPSTIFCCHSVPGITRIHGRLCHCCRHPHGIGWLELPCGPGLS